MSEWPPSASTWMAYFSLVVVRVLGVVKEFLCFPRSESRVEMVLRLESLVATLPRRSMEELRGMLSLAICWVRGAVESAELWRLLLPLAVLE